MGYFSTAAEVDCYLGGIFRLAGADLLVGRVLAAGSLTLSMRCEDPDVELSVSLFDPVEVHVGVTPPWHPDVVFTCAADLLDLFWRGRYSIVDGLATGAIVARGPVSRVLKLLPAVEPMFPIYRRLVADKDQALHLQPSATTGPHGRTHDAARPRPVAQPPGGAPCISPRHSSPTSSSSAPATVARTS